VTSVRATGRARPPRHNRRRITGRPGPSRGARPRSGRLSRPSGDRGCAARAAGQRPAWRGSEHGRAAAGDGVIRVWRPGLPAGDGTRTGDPGVRYPGLLDVAAGMPKSACRAPQRRPARLRYRSPQGHLPLVQIGSFGRVLQRVHRAGCLVRAEHRTAPAARADRLDAALAQLLDGGAVLHGDQVSYR